VFNQSLKFTDMETTYCIIEMNDNGVIEYKLFNDIDHFDEIWENQNSIVFSTRNKNEAIQTFNEINKVPNECFG